MKLSLEESSYTNKDYLVMDFIVHGEVRGNDIDGKYMIEYVRSIYGTIPVVGCEVGVYRGLHAKYMFDRVNITKLYLVDSYIEYPEYTDGPSKFMDSSKKESHSILHEYRDKIIWVEKMSSDAIEDIPSNLDFLYIDANHSYEYVRDDIISYYGKVRGGGIFGGHDYDRNHESTVRAVDEFLARENYTYLHIASGGARDWWVVKGKCSNG